MSEKRKWIILIVGGVALAGALGTLTYFEQEKIDQAREDAELLRSEIAAGRSLVSSTYELEREVIIQRETDAVIKEVLPNAAEYNDFLKTLQAFGEKAGFPITQIKPKRSSTRARGKSKQAFQEEGYSLTFNADGFQLLEFLDHVETHSRFMSVPGFKLTATKRKLSPGAELPLHQISMEVVTYVYQPKSGAEPLQIDGYDRKRDDLLSEIATRRSDLSIEGYDYRGARGRRDPWIDPRVPVEGTDEIMSVEDQIALVNDLVERTQSVLGHWEEYQNADNLIAEMKAHNALLEELGPLDEDIRRVETEGKLLFVNANRRFKDDVVAVIDDLHERLENVRGGRGPSAAALRESKEAMENHLNAGEYELALAAFEAIEPRLPLAEADELRRGLVQELRSLEHLAHTVLDFESIRLVISGVIVSETEGSIATINGQSVLPGELLDGGLLVTSIGVDEIEFLYQGIPLIRRIQSIAESN